MSVLIISHDVIGQKMAGPAIRYWELAKALGRELQVTLATPGEPGLKSNAFEMHGYDVATGKPLLDLANSHDIVLVAGYLLDQFPFLKAAGKPLVVDIYVPFILENMQIHSDKRLADQAWIHEQTLGVVNEQLRLGDFFLCASEKQRDYWLGMLLANGRVNPYTYADDRTLRRLIDVVPFGMSSKPPEHNRQVLKGAYRTITPHDKVIIWGGGIWDWFDPLTLLKATARILDRRDDIKLFFAGIRHPNVDVIPQMRMTSEAIRLSKELGLYDRCVFFNDWVPYEERQNYLLEADIGASLHFDYLETRFSFRTRLLDYIWAGLPIISTRGDAMSDLVERHGLGKTVDYEDVEGVTQALLELLSVPNLREARRPAFQAIARNLTWEKAVQPLLRYCKNPYRPSDRVPAGVDNYQSSGPPSGRRALPLRVWRHYRERGMRQLWRTIIGYVRRRMARSESESLLQE